MKPFNYEEAKKDLSKIVTRDRRHFEVLDIHLLNADLLYPLIVAYRNKVGSIAVHKFTRDGKSWDSAEADIDLFLAEDKKLIDWGELPEDTLVETTVGLRYFNCAFEDAHANRVYLFLRGHQRNSR